MIALTALTPLDGRYAAKTESLALAFSEFGLIRARLIVEVEWLIALTEEPNLPEAPSLSPEQCQTLRKLVHDLAPHEAQKVKTIEARTNHDVKAIEYFLREQLTPLGLDKLAPFVHFACTSEDINNVAHALQCRDGLKVLTRWQQQIVDQLSQMAQDFKDTPMLARTHGQTASPTTTGKEIAVFAYRLERQLRQLQNLQLTAKLNGAVGNFNAHVAAAPEVDWQALAKRIIEDKLGLTLNPFTTQIEPHDTLAELFHVLMRWNTVLIDLNRDIWAYISLGYFSQRTVAGEVGSSTMPHKVNPIDFENSEGNLGIANALLGHMADKLPVSRMQRDLSDSTVLRNIGSAFGYIMIACQSTLKGLGKLQINPEAMQADLAKAWEVLAEPIQTVMRRAGIENPYEKLKELTRGQTVTPELIQSFIESLDLPEKDRQRLLDMTPDRYTGLAAQLADQL